jgi:hypothetical protein
LYKNGYHVISDSMKSTFKLRPEDELLLYCARSVVDPKTEDKIKHLIKTDLNWDYLLTVASKHKLRPLLYWQLDSTGWEHVPNETRMDLKDFFHQNLRRNLLILGELLKILDLLKSKKITAIAYKGPLLAINAYGNLALRQFDDLDLFLHPEDVMRVKDPLISLGYCPIMELKNLQESFYLKSQREYNFSNPSKEIALEVHWKLIGTSFSFSGNKQFLSTPKNMKIVQINNHSILTLSNEELLLNICFHAAGNPWARLSWLCDIAKIIETEDIEWDALIQETIKAGAKRILLVNLRLAEELLDLNLPEIIQDLIAADNSVDNISCKVKENLFRKESSENLFQKASIRLGLRERNQDKIKDLLKVIFLPTTKELHVINLPVALYFFYYVLRVKNLLKGN